MSNKPPWRPQITVRNRSLTPLEENVVRMHYGLAGYAFSKVNDPSSFSPKTQDTLKLIEARLRLRAEENDGMVRLRHSRRGV